MLTLHASAEPGDGIRRHSETTLTDTGREAPCSRDGADCLRTGRRSPEPLPHVRPQGPHPCVANLVPRAGAGDVSAPLRPFSLSGGPTREVPAHPLRPGVRRHGPHPRRLQPLAARHRFGLRPPGYRSVESSRVARRCSPTPCSRPTRSRCRARSCPDSRTRCCASIRSAMSPRCRRSMPWARARRVHCRASSSPVATPRWSSPARRPRSRAR
jgi:hypothetical protein